MNSITITMRTDAANPTRRIGPFRAAGRLNSATLAIALAASLLALPTSVGQAQGFVTSVQPYAGSLLPEYVAVPILSAGDRVPLASDPAKQFQMTGVPDGLGA